MARTPKSVECIIQAEIVHFNKTHKVPERLLDDCNQEIAVAIMHFFSSNPDMNNSWITMNIRNISDRAGERFLKSEKLHDSRLTHDKDDDAFLRQFDCDRIKHRAICETLNGVIQDIITTTGFSDREIKLIMLVLDDPEGEMTYKEIGKIIGVSDNRAQQIYNKILRKLRHPCRSRRLRDYFDAL